MSQLSGQFTQDIPENRRYILDYTLQLSSGETITGITYSITSPTGVTPTTLTISNVTINSAGTMAFFYATGGLLNQQYEVAFLATTSIGQIFEDVIKFTITPKV
jgi:hypothetical protein